MPRTELQGFSLSDNYTVILTCERLVTLPRNGLLYFSLSDNYTVILTYERLSGHFALEGAARFLLE